MYIYKITNLINNKIYTGKRVRHKDINSYYGSGKLIKLAIKKYGKINFKKEILEFCNNKKKLSKKEIYWIKKIDSITPKGYNLTKGGEGGIGGDTLSNNPDLDKIKKKMSERRHTEETKQKLREKALLRRHTEETKEKIRKIMKDKGISGSKGYKWTEEQKKKISNRYLENNPNNVLTNKQRKEIKDLYTLTKYTYIQLGEIYNVHFATIRNVVKYKGELL